MSITPITVPKWGLEMSEGTLVSWHFAEGETVSSGDELVDFETEKIVNSLESPIGGTLRRRLAAEGDTLSVGTLIGILADDSVDETAIDAFVESFVPADTGFGPEQDVPQKSEAAAVGDNDVPQQADDPLVASAAEMRVSPIARRLADKLGVDLSDVKGTGRNGRISKHDVEQAAGIAEAGKPEEAAEASVVEEPAEPETSPENPYRSERLSVTRRTVAKRLTESKQDIPHFYLNTEVRVSRLLKMRRELNAGQDHKVSLNDLIVRAAALALRQVPEVNLNFVHDEIRYFEHADIGVAIATDDGLVAPVLRAAETKSVGEISREMSDLVTRTRDGELTQDDLSGGTFSISNLGMYDVSNFDAIINPPQGAILAVGAATERVIVIEGKAKIAPLMSVTLSCDHRVIDGALGAQYLQAFKALIENPGELV